MSRAFILTFLCPIIFLLSFVVHFRDGGHGNKGDSPIVRFKVSGTLLDISECASIPLKDDLLGLELDFVTKESIV